MKTIDPTPESFSALKREVPADTPITMLNMLRFRERAAYPGDSGFEPCSGREAYQRYSDHALAAVAKAGGQPVWMGNALSHPIAPDAERWDEVFLVYYPGVEAFLAMVMDPEYQRHTVHRTAALDDSRLICLQGRAV